MVEATSQWERLKYRLEDLKIRFQLWRLRRAGALDRILDEAAYDYTDPYGMGDTAYQVYRKDGPRRREDRVFMTLDEHDAIWWIVQRHREENEGKSH